MGARAEGKLLAGAARRDITFYEPGMLMLGWGVQWNIAHGVHTPLNARAFVFESPDGRRVAWACAELAMIPDSVRLGVLEGLEVFHSELGIGHHELMLCATHTHSGPSGYPHHFLYNLPNPGTAPRVLRGIIEGIVTAIAEAAERARPAVLRVGTERIPSSEPVAFNRSIDAYNANPDVKSVSWDERRDAVDRTSTVLRIDGEDGRPIGVMNWFPLHGTSVHSDNDLIHPDNKGIASLLCEEALGHGAVAAFAQAAAGDVSPNFRMSKFRKMMIGADDDDFESARIAGEIQNKYAALAFTSAESDSQPAEFDSFALNLDFRGAPADPRFTNGREGCVTGGSRLGMTFIEGTAEGPGPLLVAPSVARGLSQVAKARRLYKGLRSRGSNDDRFRDIHGPKYPFLDTGLGGLGRAFGGFSASEPILPGGIDPVVRAVKDFGAIDAVSDREWAPNVLPLQIMILGRLAIVGVPTEPTTQAGRRIAKSVAESLGDRVDHVVVSGYCNGYAGYTSTYEEYQLQRYEGASTLFGQWSLAVMQTTFDEVVTRLQVPADDRNWDMGSPIVDAPASDIYSQVWIR